MGTLGASRFATSSAVAAKPSSGGFFSWLTGERTSTLPPLEIPLAGVTLPPPLPDYVEPSKTKITTLPNGVKIASETSAVRNKVLQLLYSMILLHPNFKVQHLVFSLFVILIKVWLVGLKQNPAASIGLYLDCGSIYETPESFGASHLLERMAFKSTTNRSHLRIVREVEAIGGNIGASASREQMGYTFDALKTYVPQMVELLVDSVRNPAFLDWELNEEVIFVMYSFFSHIGHWTYMIIKILA